MSTIELQEEGSAKLTLKLQRKETDQVHLNLLVSEVQKSIDFDL